MILLIVLFIIADTSRSLESYEPFLLDDFHMTLFHDDLLHNLSRLELNYVYKSDNALFPYFDTSISSQYSSFTSEYEFTNATFDKICGKNGFLYYSGNLFQPIFSPLLPNLHPNMIFKDALTHKISSNIWIGGEGVKATTHYDNVNNVYIQLSGIVGTYE